jgi:hypothetical protein
VETVCGVENAGDLHQQAWLLVHKGHMQLLVSPVPRRVEPGSREEFAGGWEMHIEAAGRAEADVSSKKMNPCPLCLDPDAAPDLRIGKEPEAFGLASVAEATWLRAGDGKLESQVLLEPKDLKRPVTKENLRA